MQERIRKILEAAILAPSGDNCQPWRFAVDANRIDLYNDPAADTSYYNYRQRASLVAHGALLENIVIVAPTLGCSASMELFPAQVRPEHVARITLTEGPVVPNELAPYLAGRATNRRRYRGGELDGAQLAALSPAAGDLPEVSLFLTGQRQELERLAEVICLSDRLVFENRRLHRFLFEHIRWSDAESEKSRDGLDIKTLELSALDALGFRLLSNWGVASALGKVGATRAVADNARRLARSASAIGIILGDTREPLTYLQGGRLLQRTWLQATRLGLSFHPMAGICFLMQRVAAGEAGELAPRHVRLIEAALGEIAAVTGVPAPNVISLFRVGLAAAPSRRSQRKDLAELVR